MPSPSRRSTRSGVPPLNSKASHNTSSASSESPSRPDRGARAHKASPTPPDDSAIIEDADEEEEASAEVTRCVCGKQDYPGAPIPLQNDPAGDGDLFIQCDKCNVWQHGGCVGIMDQNKTPDTYFCEKCDKSVHQLHMDDEGQRYSLYLPFHEEALTKQRKSSTSRGNDSKLKRERDMLAKVAAELGISKRRSTTNSRHTYDEEEQLRKAIEESKRDQDATRKGKRGRDESDDVKLDFKRRRTGSESIDAGSTLNTASLDDSDDDAPTKSALKRARAYAAETQRQKEMREREKLKEQQREEAAGRRSQRAGRRRGDELDGEDPKTTPNLKAESLAPSSRPPSPPEIEVTLPSSSHKKSAGKKGKRIGRNQYTRDRDTSPVQPRVGSGSSGEEAGRGGETNGTKQSPTSGDADHAGTTSTSHKAKGKQKGKHGAVTNGMNHDKNGKSKFTTWDAFNAELTFVEDHVKEVIAHYEAKAAASDPTKRSQSVQTNGSSSYSNGPPPPPRRTTVTPLSTAHSASIMDAGNDTITTSAEHQQQSSKEDGLTPQNAKERLTPLVDYGAMPTLDHALAILKDLQVARGAFGLRRPDGPPRPDAVRQAARDLGV